MVCDSIPIEGHGFPIGLGLLSGGVCQMGLSDFISDQALGDVRIPLPIPNPSPIVGCHSDPHDHPLQ